MLLEIKILAFIGILLSIYTISIERNLKKDKKYKAACDISDKISCTKTFSSKYAHLFILPNALYGIMFYIILLFLTNITIIFYLSLIAVVGSLALAYVQIFKTKIFCLVCTSIYIVNLLLLYYSY
tara:strand:- start:823 stop:1197 length:375 start_codon:yes stop_codon:yes gene_type:complete